MEKKGIDTVPKFTELNEIASVGSGGKILFATDDWFAPAEMLINDDPAVFIEGKFTEFGKWMDGWETRRKRIAGHDWCILALGAPTVIRGIEVDTAFFTGNYAPRFSLQAAALHGPDSKHFPPRTTNKMGTACTPEQLKKVEELNSEQWTEVVPMTPLRPGYEDTRHNYYPVDCIETFTHLRLNIYPDGGIARLRVYGEIKPDISLIRSGKTLDLISMKNGGICVGFSNAHFGHPRNLIKQGKGLNMGDGWETARRLDRPAILESDSEGMLIVPGNEWAIFRLCGIGTLERVLVDTKHFKGNFPDSMKLEGALLSNSRDRNNRSLNLMEWKPIINSTKLKADSEHLYEELVNKGPFTHVRLTISPDGGVSRLRLFGKVTSTKT